MRVKEVSTDDRIYDMYLDYREDGLPPEEAKLSVARATEYDYEAVEDVLQSYNIEESKIMKRNKKENKETETITIKEEVQIPGTGVILEKGDKIQVEKKEQDSIEESFFSSTYMDDIKELMLNAIIRPNSSEARNAGIAFIQELDIAIGDQVEEDTIARFYQGMKIGLKNMA